MTCAECDSAIYCKGLCRKHYNAQSYAAKADEWKVGGRYYGSLRGTTTVTTDTGKVIVYQRSSSDPIDSYAGIHRRLRLMRGSPAQQRCECGKRADEWAYIRGSRGEVIVKTSKGRKVPASHDLMAYTAMCRSCHRKLDQGQGIQ